MLGIHHHESLEWSTRGSARHKTDFEILKRVGQGGFGTVFQVQNKLDHDVYAMKVTKQIDASVLSEVKVLSKIHHDNIVRYYGAWTERSETLHLETVPSSDDTWTSGDESLPLVIHPVCNLCKSMYRDWEVSFENWGLLDSVLQPLNLCQNCYLKSVPDSVDPDSIHIREQQPQSEYLFILMEFCHQTLQEVLSNATDSVLWDYFLQSVVGLAYLHDNNISHRDIKPSNIFVRNQTVKIGDLGLAKLTHEPSGSISDDDSSAVGTFLYTAPEVKSGQYEEWCDVYSLGVVLVEMFCTFGTGMERVITLGELKFGTIPDGFKNNYPSHAALAQSMVTPDPKRRPRFRQILDKFETKETCGHRSRDLELELTKKQQTIDSLCDLLDSHGISYEHIV